jgi:hypothetical protein
MVSRWIIRRFACDTKPIGAITHRVRRRLRAGLVSGLVSGLTAALLEGCGARTGLALEAGDDAAGAAGQTQGGGGASPGKVSKLGCSDASAKVIYLVSNDGRYFSFDPDAFQITPLGVLPCPAINGAGPFSMAVDRKATAYVVYSDGSLFRVKGEPPACEPLPFMSAVGISTFGMGFSTDLGGPSERLFVASSGLTGGLPRLGVIDPTTLAFSLIGSLPPDAAGLELTGTGDGRLFGFFGGTGLGGTSTESFFVEINKDTAQLGPKTPLPGITLGNGWAFSFWGGDFLFFTSPGLVTRINRYHSATGELTLEGTIDAEIVGAGASTCAPAQ